MLLFYTTLRLLTLADAVALLYVNPVFCALLGWLVLGERPGWKTALGWVLPAGLPPAPGGAHMVSLTPLQVYDEHPGGVHPGAAAVPHRLVFGARGLDPAPAAGRVVGSGG